MTNQNSAIEQLKQEVSQILQGGYIEYPPLTTADTLPHRPLSWSDKKGKGTAIVAKSIVASQKQAREASSFDPRQTSHRILTAFMEDGVDGLIFARAGEEGLGSLGKGFDVPTLFCRNLYEAICALTDDQAATLQDPTLHQMILITTLKADADAALKAGETPDVELSRERFLKIMNNEITIATAYPQFAGRGWFGRTMNEAEETHAVEMLQEAIVYFSQMRENNLEAQILPDKVKSNKRIIVRAKR